MKPKFGNYLRVKEAAKMLGVSPITLRRWDEQGKLKAYRHPMNRYRLYKESDLATLLRDLEESREAR